MSRAGLPFALLAVGGILLATWLAGWAVTGALLPRGRAFFAERAGWGFAVGMVLLALGVVLCFALGLRPGPIPLLGFFGIAVAVSRKFSLPLPPGEGWGEGRTRANPSPFSLLLLLLALLGLALYCLRALTEPMWSNDFQAIWGLKGKAIFGEAGIPKRFFEWPSLAFSHPEYPLGLSLVYAGVAFLLGRWEDHALALLFPFWLAATLLVLYGWLRRRGAPRPVALAAAALLAHFEPLYSAFLAGMAEVPLSFALLLVGTALSDALDRTDPGALRRLALASLAAAGTKNEGLFLVGMALALVLVLVLTRRRIAPYLGAGAALFLPAALCASLHRLVLGGHPLRDFDFRYLIQAGFLARVADTLRAEADFFFRPGRLAVAAFLALLAALGRRAPHGDRLLVLAAISLLAYLALPPLCVQGPLWLVTWTLPRNLAALMPLLAAGIAARLVGEFAPGGTVGRAGE